MFWHRLALALGATVEELQGRMSSAEFSRWIAYSSLEPFGFPVENFRAGMIAATVANVAPRKRGSKALKPSDFYPGAGGSRKQHTERQRAELAAKRERKARET